MPSAVFGAPPHAGSLSIYAGGDETAPDQVDVVRSKFLQLGCAERLRRVGARELQHAFGRRRYHVEGAIVRRRLDPIVRRQLRAGELLESRGARRPLIHDARDASGERVFKCLVWRDEDGCEDGAVLEHGDAVRRQLVRHQDAANPRGRRRRSCGIDVEDLNRFAPAVVRRIERVMA